MSLIFGRQGRLNDRQPVRARLVQPPNLSFATSPEFLDKMSRNWLGSKYGSFIRTAAETQWRPEWSTQLPCATIKSIAWRNSAGNNLVADVRIISPAATAFIAAEPWFRVREHVDKASLLFWTFFPEIRWVEMRLVH
jgi:hypothetical protein